MLAKRILPFLLMFMIMLISSGCADTGGKAAKKSAAEIKNLPPATLVFYIPGEEPADAKEVLEKAAKESGLNVKLEFKYLSYVYPSMIQTVLASNQVFDALYVGMPECYEPPRDMCPYAELARNGYLKDLSELLPEYAPDIFNQLQKPQLEAARVGGKLYAIPSLFQYWDYVAAAIDVDLLNKYKIGPINTFEDYGNFLSVIKQNEPDLIPGQLNLTDQRMFTIPYGYVLLDSALSLVYKWDDPDMKIIPIEQTEEFKVFRSMMLNWLKKGYYPSNIDGPDKVRASFIGEYGMLNGVLKDGPARLRVSDGMETHVYDNLYAFIMYKDKKIQRVNPIGNLYSNGGLAISSTSKNPERVLMFLDWVQSSRDNYNLLMYGLKDKHFTLKENKLEIPATELSKGFGAYRFWQGSPFRNPDFLRPSEADDIAFSDAGEYRELLESKTAYPPSTGFYVDYSRIMNEAGDRIQLFQQLIINTGNDPNYDPQTDEQAVRQLKEAGTDRLVAEIQRQLGEWRAGRQ